MKLPEQKTKIVATIGPASESREVMEAMIEAGMNVARINFSHGDFDGHKQVIDNLRAAARAVGRTNRHHGRPARSEDADRPAGRGTRRIAAGRPLHPHDPGDRRRRRTGFR